jgi:hypothetical protein
MATARGHSIVPTHRDSICPSLPPELWIRILSYHSDLTHLWLTCRAVSSTFCAYTEQVFAEYVLRDTHIDFQLEKYNLGGKSRRPEVAVKFAQFDAEKKVANFRVRKGDGEGILMGGKGGDRQRKWRQRLGIPEKSVMERWEERVKSSRPEMPNYTVRIGDTINDTALPGLAFDADNKEIRVEWRGMFRSFFREQQRAEVLKRRWMDQVARNVAKMENGEKILVESMHLPWSIAETQIRKEVRRKRLRDYYDEQGNDEMVWAVDSLECYEGLRKDDGGVVRSLAEIPGAGLGEKWFGSTYWVQALHMDESDCLHRIDCKIYQHSKDVEEAGKGVVMHMLDKPQQRARSMSVASTVTVS